MNEYDDEQQQQLLRTQPYQSPMYNFGSSIILLTNPESELRKMELTFRSMSTDKDGNPVPIPGVMPMMNEVGISSVVGQVQAIVSQVTIMSSLNKMEIPAIMGLMGDSLAKDLMINSKKYGIEKKQDRDKIYDTALIRAFIAMKRAFDEGLNDKKFWRGSVQEINTKVEQQGNKGGLLSSLWKK